MLCIPASVKFENFAIDHLVDAKGRYLLELDAAFPLSVKPFLFDPRMRKGGLNWHERLEIFVAVEGEGEFQTGSETTHFSPGDIMVVENMKLHGLGKLCDSPCRAISISFLSELVYNPGSPACSFALLVPFYARPTRPLIVRGTEQGAREMHQAVSRLLEAYSSENPDQVGSHVFTLELLYFLSRRFHTAGTDYTQYLQHQHRMRRLSKLLQFIQANYAEHISVEKAAEMTAMSVSRFMHLFKRSTGMTFISYLTHVRTNIAAEMLRNPEQSISEISAATGFSDQSYFGRVFRRQMGMSPMQFRTRELH